MPSRLLLTKTFSRNNLTFTISLSLSHLAKWKIFPCLPNSADPPGYSTPQPPLHQRRKLNVDSSCLNISTCLIQPFFTPSNNFTECFLQKYFQIYRKSSESRALGEYFTTNWIFLKEMHPLSGLVCLLTMRVICVEKTSYSICWSEAAPSLLSPAPASLYSQDNASN